MQKRCFFGLEALSPWPEKLPKGRLLDEKDRHMTLSFLGEVEIEKLETILPDFPPPPFSVGLSGYFDSCLTLPPHTPRVVAWHVNVVNKEILQACAKTLNEWLGVHGFLPKHADKPLLPHVTLARRPFYPKEWKKAFHPLPVTFSTLHLYESLGYSKYRSIWSYPLTPPITEMEHTADITYQIRAENYEELHQNGFLALAFTFPEILNYKEPLQSSLDAIIGALNASIAHADAEIGCPFKAVSFHGDLKEEKDRLSWEMVIDV